MLGFLILFIDCALLSYAVVVRDYNRPNFIECGSFSDLQTSELVSGGIAAKNVFYKGIACRIIS